MSRTKGLIGKRPPSTATVGLSVFIIVAAMGAITGLGFGFVFGGWAMIISPFLGLLAWMLGEITTVEILKMLLLISAVVGVVLAGATLVTGSG